MCHAGNDDGLFNRMTATACNTMYQSLREWVFPGLVIHYIIARALL